MHARAAILSQGDELTLGQTLDTNSRWLSRRLVELGVRPVEHVTLPDDRAAIRDCFRRLASCVDVIICTGGLGPTADDLTRHALADAMNDTLVEDALALEQIESWFRARGRTPLPINRVQALRPSRARCLRNDHGTAPGLAATLETPTGGVCDIFCLPGPPRELAPMFEALVVPALSPDPARAVHTRVLHTIGLGESEVAARLASGPMGDLMARDRRPSVGTTASGGIVSVRVAAEGPHADRADSLVAEVRRLLGPHVFADRGEAGEALPRAVLESLRARGQTLAVAESCTGGLLGAMLTDIPGSSASFVGGWITYSNDLKHRELGVPESLFKPVGHAPAPGAVSPEVALAMAHGARARAGSDLALAITGVAGPDGGTPDKPVGTVWVALADRRGDQARRFALASDRASVREWSARSALAMAWLRLADADHTPILREVERRSSDSPTPP